MAKEIDIRITATPLDGGDPEVSTARAKFPDTAPERGRVASEQVWLRYPDAAFVGYLHGEARFTHPAYEIVATMMWDTQGPAAKKSAPAAPVESPALFD